MVQKRFTVDQMVANTTAIFDAAMQDAGCASTRPETGGGVRTAAMPETEQIVCPCGGQGAAGRCVSDADQALCALSWL